MVKFKWNIFSSFPDESVIFRRSLVRSASLLMAISSATAPAPASTAPGPPPGQPNSFKPSLGHASWGEWHDGSSYQPAEAGFTFYTTIMDVFKDETPLADLSFGMGSTWFRRGPCATSACASQVDDPNTTCACPKCCDGGARGNLSCGWLMQSIEGGPAYFPGALPSRHLRWRIGDSVGCYEGYTGSPMFQFGSFAGHACSLADVDSVNDMPMGFIQLSNRMVMLPDGVTFDRGHGMLGVGYVRTPLGKINASDHRNFWTLVLDAHNFAGPLGYFLPEFWSRRASGWENETRHFIDFGTCPSVVMSGGAFEMNSVPFFTINTTDIALQYIKMPRLAMPIVNGRTVLFRGSRGHTNDEIMTPIEQALGQGPGSGTLDAKHLLARGQPHRCVPNNQTAAMLDGKVVFGNLSTAVEGSSSDCVWSLYHYNSSCCGNMSCGLPRYLAGNTMLPVLEANAPASLRDAEFPKASSTGPTTGPYDVLTTKSKPPSGGCRDLPGPASPTVYCARTSAPTWVAWRWYRFVDQPGLQQVLRNRSRADRVFMQQRVAALHRMMPNTMPTTTSRWIKAGDAVETQGRVNIDAAAIVTPPAGMEHGYVPIALYEGLSKPDGCKVIHQQSTAASVQKPRANTSTSDHVDIGSIDGASSASSSLPMPTPTQACPPVPPADTCQGHCLQAGHCCVGLVSNYGRPSCAQGCIIAKYTASLADCQLYCRGLAAMHNCTWTIGGQKMTSCGPANCPPGCNAFDGPFECEAGCQFARQSATDRVVVTQGHH